MIATLAVEASDRDAAAATILSQGNVVLSMRPASAWRRSLSDGHPRFPLALFSQELLVLLEAGLAMVEAIEALADKETRADIAAVLRGVMRALYEGQPLSSALEQGGAGLPALYIATIRASERTGDVQEALRRYCVYQGQVDRLKRHLAGAAIYPAVLAAVGMMVTVFLMFYVVPRFSTVYADMGGQLPWASALLMKLGQFVEAHRLALLATISLAVAGAVYSIQRPFVRALGMRLAWRLPALGQRLRLFYLARVYRTLGMLLRGGTPLLTAIPMVGQILPLNMRAQLISATQHISEGKAISESMQRFDLTTPVSLRMLRVGERTGQMGDMMERIAAFYEEEQARWIERFTKLFEPILMIFIGAMIGTIVVLMYLPIFDLAGNIQ
jgi:general secretion pathway protein F